MAQDGDEKVEHKIKNAFHTSIDVSKLQTVNEVTLMMEAVKNASADLYEQLKRRKHELEP